MKSIRLLSLPIALLSLALFGCDTTDSDRVIDQETEVFTEPATETVEVERISEDTFMVETTTEQSVDTTRIEGETNAGPQSPQGRETPTTGY